MAATKGPALVVQVGDGETVETFSKLAGVRSKTIRQGNERIDTTSDDDVALDGVSHRTHIPGILNFEIQVDGVAKGDAKIRQIVGDARLGTIRNYRVEWPGVGYWIGSMFLADFEVTAEYQGVIEFSTTLLSDAAVDWFPITDAPTNIILPAISGIAQVGVVLTASRGNWDELATFAYQWQRNDGGWANISGATAQTYTPVLADQGNALRVRVTATNSAGSATADSAPTAATLAA